MAYTTRMSLLSRVRRGDEVSWDEFYNSYKRLLYNTGKRWYSLKDQEIEDIIQEVMRVFFGASKTFKYDRSKGKFRNYLEKIFHYRALNYKSKRNKAAEVITSVESDDFGIDDLPEPNDSKLDKIWDEEWNKHVLNEALHEVKDSIDPKTFQVFMAVAIEEVPVKEVAEAFDITANNVYAIKARVLKKLTQYIKENMTD